MNPNSEISKFDRAKYQKKGSSTQTSLAQPPIENNQIPVQKAVQKSQQPIEIPEAQQTDLPLNQQSLLENPEEKFDASKYKKKYKPGLERHITRPASRTLERIGGLPGNFVKFTEWLGNQVPKLPSFLDKEPNEVQKYVGDLLKKLPTSEEIKQASQEEFGLWTTPIDSKEQIGDEFVETATDLLLPLGQQMPFFRGVTAAAFGQGAKEILKEYGAPEWAQELGKAGLILGTTMWNPGGAQQYSDNLYHVADQILPNGSPISVPAAPLVNRLTNLRSNLAMGSGEQTGAGLVIQWIDNILDHIANNNGRLNVKEGQAFSRNINQVMGDPATLQGAREFLPVVGGEVRNTMQQIEPTHPEYWNAYQGANQSHGVIAESQRLNRRIGNAIKNTPVRSRLGLLMTTAAVSPKIAAGQVLSQSLLNSFQIMQQIVQSRDLRRYYIGLTRAAATRDVGLINKAFNILDKKAEEVEAKEAKKKKKP